MPLTHKSKQLLQLSKYKTWVTDVDPSSRYFRLSQLPDVLTSGKNGFLINGSLELEPTTEVLVELIDSLGNTVFLQPIKNYSEGLARVVSIEVYFNTPPGPATLTILGQLRVDEFGNRPPIEFKDAYNVKWQKSVVINPSLGNTTPIRLYNKPSASVGEILNPLRLTSQSIQYLTGSTQLSIEGASIRNAILIGDPTKNIYLVVASSQSFTKQMEGGILYSNITTPTISSFTSSIIEVINNTMIQIDPGFVYNGIYSGFSTADFILSYTGSSISTPTEFTKSFADINIDNISTFTGNIDKIRVFASSIDSPGNAQLLMDSKVQASDLLITGSEISGQQKLRMGYFTDDSIPINYWVIGTFDSDTDQYNP